MGIQGHTATRCQIWKKIWQKINWQFVQWDCLISIRLFLFPIVSKCAISLKWKQKFTRLLPVIPTFQLDPHLRCWVGYPLFNIHDGSYHDFLLHVSNFNSLSRWHFYSSTCTTDRRRRDREPFLHFLHLNPIGGWRQEDWQSTINSLSPKLYTLILFDILFEASKPLKHFSSSRNLLNFIHDTKNPSRLTVFCVSFGGEKIHSK
jgi:hypothetical protein